MPFIGIQITCPLCKDIMEALPAFVACMTPLGAQFF
ncbi:MAG: hypothetical protein FD170_3843 [Bacteroidetes bacterium]|nr:MAG: hypothetical protein FD170_3843 [Bacteroidota bacterium]